MKGAFVYFLYDCDSTLLYIGKSSNICSRIQQHLSKQDIKIFSWKQHIDRKNIILYKCNNLTDLDIYETYFINKYNPLHNKDKTYRYTSTFELPYLEPINPFNEKFKNTNLILSLWTKINRDEKDAFLGINNNGIKSYYLSLDKNRDIYLDSTKYGNMYVYEHIDKCKFRCDCCD